MPDEDEVAEAKMKFIRMASQSISQNYSGDPLKLGRIGIRLNVTNTEHTRHSYYDL